MHAFPNVNNAPSNAICRKLGFSCSRSASSSSRRDAS